MNSQTMRGVYPILVTPFHEDGRIDEESLRRLIDFNIEAGVHGLGVALGSEIYKLSEAERDLMTRVVVEQTAGRVKVVINTGAPGADLAIHYSRRAQELGADALMILPPAFMPAGAAEVMEYYGAISDAVQIPIFMQDVVSSTIPAGLARQVAQACEWVQYVKVESAPITAKVADMVSTAGEYLTVFGGAGGGYFIEEMRRGSVGTMPFCSQPEAFVQIWNHFQDGDEATARAVFNQMLIPISRISGQGVGLFHEIHKELLRHRGIIRTSKVRGPAPSMDALTRRELQQLLDELYPQ